MSRPLKIGASVAVVAGALGWLLYGTVSEGAEYYKHVDEVLANPSAWTGKRLQVHGFVPLGSLQRKKGTLEYRFVVERYGKRIPVSYTGIVPDTFKEGAEVVVKGRLLPDGSFAGSEVIAKCPSKYEPGAVRPGAPAAATPAMPAMPAMPAPKAAY